MLDNPIDAVILAAVFTLLVLIVRGMLRGSIRTCDPGSCGGNCARCKTGCPTPRIQLTDDQLAQLSEIDRRAKGVVAQ